MNDVSVICVSRCGIARGTLSGKHVLTLIWMIMTGSSFKIVSNWAVLTVPNPTGCPPVDSRWTPPSRATVSLARSHSASAHLRPGTAPGLLSMAAWAARRWRWRTYCLLRWQQPEQPLLLGRRRQVSVPLVIGLFTYSYDSKRSRHSFWISKTLKLTRKRHQIWFAWDAHDPASFSRPHFVRGLQGQGQHQGPVHRWRHHHLHLKLLTYGRSSASQCNVLNY